ncbi:MAG TPA: GNAT family protein [Gemmatimonadota bacterium]|nr:GNAT family protein [Gemmatimonadota bacterium]
MQVKIRPYRTDDVAALVDAARESTREVFPWLPWCHPAFSESEARGWIESQVEAWTQKQAFEFCITDEQSRFLGGCGINQINLSHRFANVGYWVRTAAAGSGVASAAVKQAIEFACQHTDLIRLEIVVGVGNFASVRVAEKVGATFEGTLRNRLLLHGSPHDAHMYSVTLAH